MIWQGVAKSHPTNASDGSAGCASFSKRNQMDFVEEKRKSPKKFDNFVLDFVSESLKKGQKPTYVRTLMSV